MFKKSNRVYERIIERLSERSYKVADTNNYFRRNRGFIAKTQATGFLDYCESLDENINNTADVSGEGLNGIVITSPIERQIRERSSNCNAEEQEEVTHNLNDSENTSNTSVTESEAIVDRGFTRTLSIYNPKLKNSKMTGRIIFFR